MLRKSLTGFHSTYLLQDDKKKCRYITAFILVQCVFMFVASITILKCVWKPSLAPFDYYKLASIMYLCDKKACGYTGEAIKLVTNLRLSNDTRGLSVRPIPWQPAIVSVSTRISAKTRKYISISVAMHVIWMFLAIALRIIIKSNQNSRLLKFILSTFFYSCIFVILFDLSMGIVYVAHIKQSLTKGMIVRYSGWGVMKLKNPDDFAGWLPMVASACWMRGIIILALNVYCCRILQRLRNKIWKIEVRRRYMHQGNLPIPEPISDRAMDDKVLYYKPGDIMPHTNKGPEL